MRGVLAINGGEVTEVAVQGSGSAFLRRGGAESVLQFQRSQFSASTGRSVPR